MNIVLFFLNSLIRRGKKQKVVVFLLNFVLFLKIKSQFRYGVVRLLTTLLFRIVPLLGFFNKSLSGRKYKIPCFLTAKKACGIGLRWLIKNSNLRSEKTFSLKLVGEFNDVLQGKSKTVRQRKEHHLLAFENKQYLYLARKKKKKGKGKRRFLL